MKKVEVYGISFKTQALLGNVYEYYTMSGDAFKMVDQPEKPMDAILTDSIKKHAVDIERVVRWDGERYIAMTKEVEDIICSRFRTKIDNLSYDLTVHKEMLGKANSRNRILESRLDSEMAKISSFNNAGIFKKIWFLIRNKKI